MEFEYFPSKLTWSVFSINKNKMVIGFEIFLESQQDHNAFGPFLLGVGWMYYIFLWRNPVDLIEVFGCMGSTLWREDIDGYCWWKKSCTSWYVVFPIIHRVLYISGGAGFQPSTVSFGFTHPGCNRHQLDDTPYIFIHFQLSRNPINNTFTCQLLGAGLDQRDFPYCWCKKPYKSWDFNYQPQTGAVSRISGCHQQYQLVTGFQGFIDIPMETPRSWLVGRPRSDTMAIIGVDCCKEPGLYTYHHDGILQQKYQMIQVTQFETFLDLQSCFFS